MLGYKKGQFSDSQPLHPILTSLENGNGDIAKELASPCRRGKFVKKLIKRYEEKFPEEEEYGLVQIYIKEVIGIDKSHVLSRTIDPYVVLRIESCPTATFQTQVQKKSPNPVFNESCFFLCYPDSDVLDLELWDEDPEDNQILDTVSIPIKQLIHQHDHKILLLSGKADLSLELYFTSFLRSKLPDLL